VIRAYLRIWYKGIAIFFALLPSGGYSACPPGSIALVTGECVRSSQPRSASSGTASPTRTSQCAAGSVRLVTSECSAPTAAATSAPASAVALNSCGPGSGWLALVRVPAQAHEIVTAGRGYSFDPACRSHDACYAKCAEPRRSQESCDAEFGRNLESICAQVNKPSDRRKCDDNRLVYWGYVLEHGNREYGKACVRASRR